ncbi:MAG: TonB-dependent receptor [Bacteroidota bacterium]|jgi:hypothetical protein
MKYLLRYSFICGLLVVVIGATAFAGNTGKIVGKVTDAKTGEALLGVNVQVLTTTRGAVTDPEGKYTIIGVPIGRYSVKASMVGYQEVEITGVKIGADETTQLNFELTSTEVALPTVIITADQKLVNPLTTSSTQTVSSKAIEQIPDVKEVQDVVKMQAGVVKQGNNLFLRGGRSNEVQYLVDGIPTNDVLGGGELATANTSSANAQLGALYAGMSSGVIGGGTSGLVVSANSIQSVSVQTSGFDADYGNAQSGIVNIVTKSGSDRYTGTVMFRTDKLQTSNQNETFSSMAFGGPEPITKFLMSSVGVTIPGSLTFFFNADADRSNGAYQYVHNSFYNPVERKVALNGFLGGLFNGLGFTYNDEQNNTFTFNSKIRYDMSGADQIFYTYRTSVSTSDGYYHPWRYLADSSGLTGTLSSQHTLSWTHFFGANSFVRLNLGRVETHTGNDVAGLLPYQYTSAHTQQNPNGDGFYYLGSDQYWASSLTRVWTARFDLNSQVHPLHLLKAGFEFDYEEINSTQISGPTEPTTINGVVVYPPFSDTTDYGQDRSRGEYPYYGQYRYVLNNFPNRGAAYVQDNIEFSGLNLHVGLRYDYFDVGRQVYYDQFIQDWMRDVNGSLPPALQVAPSWVNAQTSPGEFLSDGKRFQYYLTHGYFSPRLSIGYPVTDRIVFYFNYGHFLQYPDRTYYYQDPHTLSTGGTVGNPGLQPQRTVAYESGFEDQFNEDMSFGLHAFYKDIFDYPSSITRTGYMNIWSNFDYASARGFELTFNQAFTGNLSTSFSYTYQIAKGRASSPLASVFDPNSAFLPRETRLSWDQTNTANIFLTYRVGPKEEGRLLGLPFINNYGMSLTWTYGSGLPYTPYVRSYNARNVFLINSQTGPFSSTVNLSLYKGFLLYEKINLLVTLDVLNVLDRRNVVSLDGGTGFNTQLGRPYSYGDIDPNTNYIRPWYGMDILVPPYVFDSPRQILLGVKINWE